MELSGEVIWELIKKQLENNELEFKTKRNLWFSAIYMDNKIYIDKAKNDEPSCKVNMIRYNVHIELDTNSEK